MLGGEEQGEFGADVGAGLPEEPVGEFEKPGEVVSLVDAVFAASSVVRARFHVEAWPVLRWEFVTGPSCEMPSTRPRT